MASESEMQSVNEVPDAKKQKREKKKKEKALLEQIEFYFSDANLSKDKFLSELIKTSEDGMVEVSTFLKFNKVQSLTNSEEEISKALSKSTFLQLSEDGKRVKRPTPVNILKDVNQCTIYVENLPSTTDHDWLKEKFKPYGKVVYVSLPKFRNSGLIKGFAFVEFDKMREAEAAVNAFKKPAPTTTATTDSEGPPKKKRKVDESTNEDVNKESDAKQKPKHKTKKTKEKKEQDLRVISKLEWKRYRNKFLKLQKTNMTEMKKYLSSQRHKNETKQKKEAIESEAKATKPAPEFVPKVIIKLTLDEPIKEAKTLRNELKSLIGVMYVEAKNEDTVSYIRCENEDITTSVLESVSKKGKAQLLQDEEEKSYWDKINADRSKKFSCKNRPKSRGFDKIMNRALNISMEKTALTHIRFDE